MRDPAALNTFRQTGLLHLMVVSGSHLQLLSVFILMIPPRRVRERFWVRCLLWTGLTGYCLLTGFQAPVVRALLARLFARASLYFTWNWDAGKCHLASGLLLLALMPSWILSSSFYLSWLASLGFFLAPLSRSGTERTRKGQLLESWIACSLIQTFMSVFFSRFSVLGLVINALFAPLISVILFPLSIAVVVFPWSSPLASAGWDLLLGFLERILRLWPLGESAQRFPDISSARWILLWAFLAGLQCFFEWLRRYRFQRSHV